jgi:hypothetical protein
MEGMDHLQAKFFPFWQRQALVFSTCCTTQAQECFAGYGISVLE